MYQVKITAANGNSTLIVDRERESEFECKIIHVSSTSEQPYIAINFNKDGVAVGGRTMTKGLIDNLIKQAKTKGMRLDEISKI